MSPKPQAGPYAVTIIREQDRSNFDLLIDAATTFSMLKAKIVSYLSLEASVEVTLRHNGHKTQPEDKVLLKNPIQMQEKAPESGIDASSTVEQLKRHTIPQLQAWCTGHAVPFTKSNSKDQLMDIILKFNSPSEAVEINIETPRGSIITKLVRPGDTIKIADFETQADSESTTWWNSEEAAESQAQFKTDKQ